MCKPGSSILHIRLNGFWPFLIRHPDGKETRFTDPEVKLIRMNIRPKPEAIYRADW